MAPCKTMDLHRRYTPLSWEILLNTQLLILGPVRNRHDQQLYCGLAGMRKVFTRTQKSPLSTHCFIDRFLLDLAESNDSKSYDQRT
jgi:hypothetical protein